MFFICYGGNNPEKTIRVIKNHFDTKLISAYEDEFAMIVNWGPGYGHSANQSENHSVSGTVERSSQWMNIKLLGMKKSLKS
jgi:hypothetical protein